MPREAWQLRDGCSGHGGLMEELGQNRSSKDAFETFTFNYHRKKSAYLSVL